MPDVNGNTKGISVPRMWPDRDADPAASPQPPPEASPPATQAQRALIRHLLASRPLLSFQLQGRLGDLTVHQASELIDRLRGGRWLGEVET